MFNKHETGRMHTLSWDENELAKLRISPSSSYNEVRN